MFIPEGKVPTILGTSGQQISSIQKSSNALVSMQKKLSGLRERAVRVSGKVLDVKDAISVIYKLIFEKKTSSPRRARDLQHDGISIRFVAPSDIVKEVSSRHSSLSKKLRTDFNVEVSIRDSKTPLKESESVVVSVIYEKSN